MLKKITRRGMAALLLTNSMFLSLNASAEEKIVPVSTEPADMRGLEDLLKQLPKKSLGKLSYPIYNSLRKSQQNRPQIFSFLKQACALGEKEGKAAIFLTAYMPDRDLISLKSDFLLNNLKLAFKARRELPWGKNVPFEVFCNDVLPYAVVNETRENWRKPLYDKFLPLIKDCKTMREAVIKLNAAIAKTTGVKYSTNRPRPDLSPLEAMQSTTASCTGLSILLADSLRAISVPARFAGIPAWVHQRGNHNWNEVWLDDDKSWHLTEFYPDSKGLDHGWLIPGCAQAKPKENQWEHRVYATSWAPKQEYWFPLVWDINVRYVHGIDRNEFYQKLHAKKQAAKKAALVGTRQCGIEVLNAAGERQVCVCHILNEAGEVQFKGKSPAAIDDANKLLTGRLKFGQSYFIEVMTENKVIQRKKVNVTEGKSLQRFTLRLDK